MTDRSRIPALFGAAALLLPGIAVAAVKPAQLVARLTPTQESPPQQVRNPRAAGTFTVTARPATNGYRLVWKLTFTRLSGAATSAYIHRGNRGTHGAALIHLCSPCRSGATGDEYLSPSELTLARRGKLYVNVRTLRNPDGEIRGQLRVS
jgi:hypothetical protein